MWEPGPCWECRVRIIMSLDSLLVLVLFVTGALMVLLQTWYALHGARLQLPVIGMALLFILGAWLMRRGARRHP